MRNVKQEIGAIIKKRREILGLLQPQLAAITKVSIRTLQLVEAGKGNPSLNTLIQLAVPLGLTLKLTLRDLSEHNNP